MDQLKTQLGAIKQHSFWAMCIGILGVTIGGIVISLYMPLFSMISKLAG